MRVPAPLRRLPLGDERGIALLVALFLVLIMTLLGVALFEMSTIEASLARGDLSEVQAFYCAEAQAARIYGLYAPAEDAPGQPGPQTFAPTALALAGGTYLLSGSVSVDAATRVVTVTATCTLPDGRTRTVQRRGTRGSLTPGQPSDAARAWSWKDCGSNPRCP